MHISVHDAPVPGPTAVPATTKDLDGVMANNDRIDNLDIMFKMTLAQLAEVSPFVITPGKTVKAHFIKLLWGLQATLMWDVAVAAYQQSSTPAEQLEQLKPTPSIFATSVLTDVWSADADDAVKTFEADGASTCKLMKEVVEILRDTVANAKKAVDASRADKAKEERRRTLLQHNHTTVLPVAYRPAIVQSIMSNVSSDVSSLF